MSAYRQSMGAAPQLKPTTLYVLAAFDRADDGELRPAFQPQQMPSESAAVARAKLMISQYAGVIAWSRAARPDEGDSASRSCSTATAAFPIWSDQGRRREIVALERDHRVIIEPLPVPKP